MSTELGPVAQENIVHVEEIHVCTGGCACCAMSTMITFIVLFVLEIVYVVASKDVLVRNIQDEHTQQQWLHFMNVMLWMYAFQIVITALFLFCHLHFKLYVRWNQTPNYFCVMISTLFAIWIVTAVLTTTLYEEQYETEIAFRTVLGLIILVTFCGPFFLVCLLL